MTVENFESIDVLFKKEPYSLFINGEYEQSEAKDLIKVENPQNGETLAEVYEGKEADVDKAIKSAQQAFKVWKKYDREERAEILEKFATLFEQELDRLSYMESYQTGRPIREMKAQLGRLPEWYRYYAALLRTYEEKIYPFGKNHHAYSDRFPLGVVGLITPWNHPLLILTKKLAPALAAGNCVVIKPSELAPVTTLELGKIANEAGFPKGVINIVPGYGHHAGAFLTKDERLSKIDVTGGTKTGKVIAGLAGANLTSVSCELGGKTSVLFFDDIELDRAVNAAAFASFIATGQTCVQGARLLVQDTIYDEFVERLVDKVKNIKIGNPIYQDTQMGPLISENQRNLVEKYTKIGIEEGAKLVYGGKVPESHQEGYYYEPTIFADVTNDMRIAQEEIFGPVTTVIPFSTEKEAIRLANSTEFGLGMSVWTNNVSRSMRVSEQLESGIVWVNDHHRIDPAAPWGGIKLSGLGKENGIKAYLDYTHEKTVVINKSEETFDWYKDGEIQRYS